MVSIVHGGERSLAASIGIVSYLGGSGAAAGAAPGVCEAGSRTVANVRAACSRQFEFEFDTFGPFGSLQDFLKFFVFLERKEWIRNKKIWDGKVKCSL